jgi:hypothetical protein
MSLIVLAKHRRPLSVCKYLPACACALPNALIQILAAFWKNRPVADAFWLILTVVCEGRCGRKFPEHQLGRLPKLPQSDTARCPRRITKLIQSMQVPAGME